MQRVGSKLCCPRCGGPPVNFHPGWTTKQLTCRWCVYLLWARQLKHDAERALAEAERIEREAEAA
jgi:hypothetical protein